LAGERKGAVSMLSVEVEVDDDKARLPPPPLSSPLSPPLSPSFTSQSPTTLLS